jgi:hypothetical protein
MVHTTDTSCTYTFTNWIRHFLNSITGNGGEFRLHAGIGLEWIFLAALFRYFLLSVMTLTLSTMR